MKTTTITELVALQSYCHEQAVKAEQLAAHFGTGEQAAYWQGERIAWLLAKNKIEEVAYGKS